MARWYPPRTPLYRAHGEGLSKAYGLGGRDIAAKRARRRYEPTTDDNRLALRRKLHTLDVAREREKFQDMQALFKVVHLKLRVATRRNGRPPKTFVLYHDGEIFTSEDPQRLPRKVVADAIARKMKARKRR
jgi:hypothetical protein